MKKKPKSKVAFLPIFLSLSILVLSVGYASVNSITGEITGKLVAEKQDGIFITDVEYYSSYNVDYNDSNINDFVQSTLNSSVVLSPTNGDSTITYKITVYNSTSEDYYFNDVLYGDEFYDNSKITFSLIDLEKKDVIISKGYLTFYITFSYVDGVASEDNMLNSYLNFEFLKFGSGNLELTYTITEAWTQNDLYFYKADFILTNISDKVIDYWNIDIPFPMEFMYNSGWGDGYTVNITPDETNKVINVNSSEILAIGGFVKFSIQFGVYSDTFDFDEILITDHVADDSGEDDNTGEEMPITEVTTSGIEVTFDKTNSWDAGENSFYSQYNVTVTNTSSEVITDWQIVIEVPYGSKVEQSWNLECVNNEYYVVIKPISTSSSLNPGESYTQGGFVINATHINFVPEIKLSN